MINDRGYGKDFPIFCAEASSTVRCPSCKCLNMLKNFSNLSPSLDKSNLLQVVVDFCTFFFFFLLFLLESSTDFIHIMKRN
jgi:hypothetical protein